MDWKRLNKYKLVIILIYILVLVFIFLLGNNGLLVRTKIRNKIDRTMREITQLKEQNRQYALEIKRLKDDPVYQSYMIRKMGYIGSNEQVYKFQFEQPVTNIITSPRKLFWRNFYSFLMKYGPLILLIFFIAVLTVVYAIIIYHDHRSNRN